MTTKAQWFIGVVVTPIVLLVFGVAFAHVDERFNRQDDRFFRIMEKIVEIQEKQANEQALLHEGIYEVGLLVKDRYTDTEARADRENTEKRDADLLRRITELKSQLEVHKAEH